MGATESSLQQIKPEQPKEALCGGKELTGALPGCELRGILRGEVSLVAYQALGSPRALSFRNPRMS